MRRATHAIDDALETAGGIGEALKGDLAVIRRRLPEVERELSGAVGIAYQVLTKPKAFDSLIDEIRSKLFGGGKEKR